MASHSPFRALGPPVAIPHFTDFGPGDPISVYKFKPHFVNVLIVRRRADTLLCRNFTIMRNTLLSAKTFWSYSYAQFADILNVFFWRSSGL
jgi:hypothetical protein